ncbi:3'(2'),5'-bisphosphate nucleotidase CysQ [Phaeobacter gallaeciensis]|uniref:3'(2'),5'-bisphosphate nucleotidase CysQ n=2 Tax=Roseobacteraceae TaxID=2854170 RepID=A0A366X6G5_9RHOB|nr:MULTISPECIES: 3'(2'),5'-bisphosphate nucleotidase CysQ [Roseobacteraceae]MBT3141921.1 3'(2'),5'-bisphosphate nucleotidase CysQ [Falsiruegeria litorea]MBT8168732.1 3'(2'),5'-bisphosphate nucleotidase CysQ [Falsiruegeria litorea]RBW60010.1 3'(2'),5'-bisphosphate nucleotidase CysQ [Phaeobacter gallaeciensis]
MPAADLDLLIEAALESGRIATRFSGADAKRWDKPDGAGPVTEADLAVNEMLEDRLPSARPDYGWLSEETEDNSSRLNKDRVFIVDPIDGTRSFAEGAKTWAHSLAIADHGIVTAAVIYLPLRDLLYTAEAGKGAQLNGVPICISEPDTLSAANLLAAKPNLAAQHWLSGQPPQFGHAYRPSLAYRMALVAQGRFDGMLTLRASWEWDIAAGDLIIREAGGLCTDRAGLDLRFNNACPKLNGVVAGGELVHEEVSVALNPESPGIPG